MTRILSGVILACALWALAGAPALADVSFKGKTVRVIVASNAGGGTDLAGRLINRFMKKYLSGDPRFVYQYMGAGGGKIKAANYLANRIKPDGLTLMNTDSSPLQPHILRRKVIKYDPRKFIPIGGVHRGGSVLFVRKDAHKRLTDKNAAKVNVGGTSGARAWQAMNVWGAEFLGWNLKWIVGYPGTGALVKAISQGEIDILGTQNAYIINELKEAGVIDLIAQEGTRDAEGYSPRSSFKDVAIFPELMAAKNVGKLAMAGYESWMGPSTVDKWLTLPPKTPPEYVKAYRDAFQKAVNDPEFLKIARKQFSIDLTAMTGETLEKRIVQIVDAPKEALDYASKLRKKYDVPER